MKDNFYELFPDNRGNGDTVLRQSQFVMLRILKIVDYICKKNDIKYWLDAGTLIGAIRHNGFIPWDDDIDICMPREDYNKFIEIAKHELPDDLFLQTQETDIYYPQPWAKVRDNNSLLEEYIPGSYHKGIFIDVFPVDTYSKLDDEAAKYKNRFKIIFRTLTLIKEPLEKNSSMKVFLKNMWKIVMRTLLFPYALMGRQAMVKKLNKTKLDIISKITDPDGEYIGYGVEFIYWPKYYKYKINKNDIYPLIEYTFEDGKFSVPKNFDLYLTEMFGDYMQMPPEDQRVCHNLSLVPNLNVKNGKNSIAT